MRRLSLSVSDRDHQIFKKTPVTNVTGVSQELNCRWCNAKVAVKHLGVVHDLFFAAVRDRFRLIFKFLGQILDG